MKHVPCVSPYSPDSIDPGFVEIGLVQLSHSVKKTNVIHTHVPTDKLNNGTLYAPRYEEAFLPAGRQKMDSVASLSRPWLIMNNFFLFFGLFFLLLLYRVRLAGPLVPSRAHAKTSVGTPLFVHSDRGS